MGTRKASWRKIPPHVRSAVNILDDVVGVKEITGAAQNNSVAVEDIRGISRPRLPCLLLPLRNLCIAN